MALALLKIKIYRPEDKLLIYVVHVIKGDEFTGYNGLALTKVAVSDEEGKITILFLCFFLSKFTINHFI